MYDVQVDFKVFKLNEPFNHSRRRSIYTTVPGAVPICQGMVL